MTTEEIRLERQSRLERDWSASLRSRNAIGRKLLASISPKVIFKLQY